MEEDKPPIVVKRAEWKIEVEKFLENFIVVATMSAVTVYTLFFDDIRAAAFGMD